MLFMPAPPIEVAGQPVLWPIFAHAIQASICIAYLSPLKPVQTPCRKVLQTSSKRLRSCTRLPMLQVTVMERKPMIPKHSRGPFQGTERGGRGEGRTFRQGRDNRGRGGRSEGRPYTGGRTDRGEGKQLATLNGQPGISISPILQESCVN